MKKLFTLLAFVWSLSAFSQSADGLFKTVTASGTNTYTISDPNPNAVNYDSKEKWIVTFTNASTGNVTLNRAGIGAKIVRDSEGTQLASGDILAGQRLLLSYNGTYYQVVGGSGGSVDVAADYDWTGDHTFNSPGNFSVIAAGTTSLQNGANNGVIIDGTGVTIQASNNDDVRIDTDQLIINGAPGTEGQVLTSHGASSPDWETLIAQTITNGVTTSAPSQDAVFDANALKADLASPTFTGTPAAPTASPGTNTTQLATTAFVIANAGGGAVSSVVDQTGAITARHIREGTSQVFNLLDNGCVNDGTTDNSTALAALITAAPAGSVIFVPAGTGFNFVTGLTITKKLHFKGESLGAKMMTSSNITILTFSTSGSDESTVERIWFAGSDAGASQRGVRIVTSRVDKVTNCLFTDFNLAAVSQETNPTAPYDGPQITNNIIASCAGIGIDCPGQYTFIGGNTIFSCGTGIFINWENNRIVGGSVTSCTTGIDARYGKLIIDAVSVNHNTTNLTFLGATQPIHFFGNALAGAVSISNCRYVSLRGAASSITINNQASASVVNVQDCYLTGGLTLSSGNAVGSNIWFIDNDWEQTGPTMSIAGSATIYQSNNLQGDGTILKIPRASIEASYADISLTNAQVLALRGTPITMVVAPGAGYMVEFIKAELAFDYTAAYTESTDNLEFRWGAAGAAASETIECTGFVDATADVMIQALTSASTVRAKAVVDNLALVLQNNGDGEFGGGNASNVIRVRVHYRIVSLGW